MGQRRDKGVTQERLKLLESVKEIWYQSFNQQRWEAALVGRDRETCRTYIRHFLDHWTYKPGLFDEYLEAWVDNFMEPGNVRGSFNWHVGIDKARIEIWRQGAPELPKIRVATRFFWGQEEPLIRIGWADRLSDYFSDYWFEAAQKTGHFVHYESPSQKAHCPHREFAAEKGGAERGAFGAETNRLVEGRKE